MKLGKLGVNGVEYSLASLAVVALIVGVGWFLIG